MRLNRNAATTMLALCFAASVTANDLSPEQLFKGGHWKRLRGVAQSRFSASPNDAYANYLLGWIKFQLGDLESAEPLAEKAIALDGGKADYHYLLSAVAGRQAEQASILSQFGLARKFKREAEAAIQLDWNHLDARRALIQFHLRAPGIVGGDKKEAYRLADEMVRINPAEGYLEKGGIARREKLNDQIEPFYLKALEADPKNYRVRVTLAEYYGAAAKYDVAEKHAREALKVDASRVGAYSSLAGMYANQGRWTELDAILARAEKNVADNLAPLYQAGRVLVLNGKDVARAERYFRKYLTQEPELTAPSLGAAHWRLGQALEKQGRVDEARREYEEAVRLDPKLEDTKKDLKRLKK